MQKIVTCCCEETARYNTTFNTALSAVTRVPLGLHKKKADQPISTTFVNKQSTTYFLFCQYKSNIGPRLELEAEVEQGLG